MLGDEELDAVLQGEDFDNFESTSCTHFVSSNSLMLSCKSGYPALVLYLSTKRKSCLQYLRCHLVISRLEGLGMVGKVMGFPIADVIPFLQIILYK